MVPVPEEHVLEVMRYITRIVARASGTAWDEAAIAEVWNDVDESCRALLAEVATASSAEVELDAERCAREIGASVREVAAMVNELNSVARDTYRPNLIVAPVAGDQLPDGSVTEKRLLRMDLDTAALIASVQRSDDKSSTNSANRPTSMR
jgi:hypothetical protein